MSTIGIALLGSTGSIGRQTLDVVARHPDRFRIVALTAAANHDVLRQQVDQFQPSLIVAKPVGGRLPDLGPAELLSGVEGLIAAATHPDADIVVVATSGHDAMLPTYRAIEAGKTIALANKETVVCAGELMIPFARERGVEIRPVDSEHSAVWQSLGRSSSAEIARLMLTASGGPFRTASSEELAQVTVAQALAHPTWNMGTKLTIDSATLMNKGLELIEAHWLFSVPYPQIEVIVHPESIIHSLVEFADGSQIAQLSLPDMRLPIQYALTYPDHLPSPCTPLDLTKLDGLHFEEPDLARFPCLTLCRQAGEAGQTYPTVLSAADEIAVASFMEGRIGFLDISTVIADVLDQHRATPVRDFDAITSADAWARTASYAAIQRLED